MYLISFPCLKNENLVHDLCTENLGVNKVFKVVCWFMVYKVANFHLMVATSGAEVVIIYMRRRPAGKWQVLNFHFWWKWDGLLKDSMPGTFLQFCSLLFHFQRIIGSWESKPAMLYFERCILYLRCCMWYFMVYFVIP